MKIHRALSLPAVVVAGALCCAAPPPAWAQTAAAQTVTDPLTGLAVQTVSSATVAVSGTVSGGTESVALSGKATIESRVVWSELNTIEPAAVTLNIDLSGISGTGKTTKAKYVTTAQEIALRRLSATDLVDVSFPFYISGTGGFPSARTGLAKFSLLYDVNTGVLKSASGSLTSP
jgi:hypothetical protein